MASVFAGNFGEHFVWHGQAIMKRTPVPMTPLESLASSAVRTAHKVRHSSGVYVFDILTAQGVLGHKFQFQRVLTFCPA